MDLPDHPIEPTGAKKPLFAAGDEVRVRAGMLQGVQGVVLAYCAASRLTIAVHLNCEGVTLEVDEGLLELAPPSSLAHTCLKPLETRRNQQSSHDCTADSADDAAFCAALLEVDLPELAHVVAAWPWLSEEARRAIAALAGRMTSLTDPDNNQTVFTCAESLRRDRPAGAGRHGAGIC